MGSHSLSELSSFSWPIWAINRSKFRCFNSSIDLVQIFIFQNVKPVDFQRACLVFHWKGSSLESLNYTLQETNVGAAWASINIYRHCPGKGPTLVDWTWETSANRASNKTELISRNACSNKLTVVNYGQICQSQISLSESTMLATFRQPYANYLLCDIPNIDDLCKLPQQGGC